ncbi:hypothetical protein N7G274_010350 [Stereocaulon virgatum]|uniref:Uncharacterized protein n=1 Tax=Stereocaulon virgatum TaxID=373712 RepID=A0ABR3ZUW7_9LECA
MSQAPPGPPRAPRETPPWSDTEQFALVYFTSLGINRAPVSYLIAYKAQKEEVRGNADVVRRLDEFRDSNPGLLDDGRRLDKWLRERLTDTNYRNLKSVGDEELAIIRGYHGRHGCNDIQRTIAARERDSEQDEEERRRQAEHVEGSQWWRARNREGELPQ